MQKSASPRRKRVRVLAAFGTLTATLVPAGALLAGVTPAQAANFANQPDTQVAVFMVPLTILVLALLFEVARFLRRQPLPVPAPTRPPRPTSWADKDSRR